jgi:putative addiction module component (TIGR02574 family)
MAQDISEVLKQAMALPSEARAALAGALLDSLDEAVEASVEAEWDREIARRIEELDSGKVKPIPWAEARQQIAAALNGRWARDPSSGAGRNPVCSGVVSRSEPGCGSRIRSRDRGRNRTHRGTAASLACWEERDTEIPAATISLCRDQSSRGSSCPGCSGRARAKAARVLERSVVECGEWEIFVKLEIRKFLRETS